MAVKLMSRDDMLQRLKETNNPKLVSLEKWELLVLWHEENGDTEPYSTFIGGSSCAFCHVHYKHGLLCTNTCEGCPIDSQNAGCGWGSVWIKYYIVPSLENAKAMVKMIKELKDE